MAKLTIYVGDALEARMAGHKDNLNWSNLAQAAFERAIDLEELKGQNVEQASIERLRQSRSSNEERREAEGHAAGKEWALNVADYEELERVAKIDVDIEIDADGFAKTLASAFLDDEGPSWSETSETMEALFGRASPTIAEVRGFINGATEVYDLV